MYSAIKYTTLNSLQIQLRVRLINSFCVQSSTLKPDLLHCRDLDFAPMLGKAVTSNLVHGNARQAEGIPCTMMVCQTLRWGACNCRKALILRTLARVAALAGHLRALALQVQHHLLPPLEQPCLVPARLLDYRSKYH